MIIGKISLKNFRCFKNVVLYPRRISLLIGENDSGKTSILHALKAIFSNRYLLTPDDIYVDNSGKKPEERDPLEIEISIIPDRKEEGFSAEEHSIFLEHFDINEEKEEFLRVKLWYGWDGNNEEFRSKINFMKKDGEGAEFTSKYAKHFGFFSVDINRDINKEIGNKRGLWSKILDNTPMSKDVTDEVLELYDQINVALHKDEGFNGIKNNFERRLSNMLVIPTGSEEFVKISPLPEEPEGILEDADIRLKCISSDTYIPIDRHGTGLQSASVIALFCTRADNEYNMSAFFTIEEPEAHLHPHVQRRLFREIIKLGNQVFVTTHSTFITDQCDLNDIILLRQTNNGCITKQVPLYEGGEPFLPDDWVLKIKRYIEGNNSEIFFSRCVILSEGDSERYAIPVFAKAMGIDLDGRGISLVCVNSSDFDPFIKIMAPYAFDIPWVILCDEDAEKKVAKKLEDFGYLKKDTVKDTLKKNASFKPVLQNVGCYTIPKNFEKFLVDGFTNEYKQAIEELDGKDALFCYIKSRDDTQISRNSSTPKEELFSSRPIEDQILTYVINYGKPRYARKIAEIITSNGEDPSKIPDEFKLPIEMAKKISESLLVSNNSKLSLKQAKSKDKGVGSQ